jgi:hypothetical protein
MGKRMTPSNDARAAAPDELRSALVERLGARRPELDDAVFAHIRSMSHPAGDRDASEDDVGYELGLRAAVTAAIDYSLIGIEHGDGWSGPIPTTVEKQARRAARSSVSLDIVLLRCSAARALLGDFVMDEGDRLPSDALRRAMRSQASALDRVMAAIVSAYRDELDRVHRSPAQRRVELVQDLLAESLADRSELGYELDAWHLGVIASGADAGKLVEHLAARLPCQLLAVSRDEETTWAWLGRPQMLATADLERVLTDKQVAGVSLAIGEPGHGIDGWRLTHCQAQDAFLVSLHQRQRLTRYADVLLLAAALRNDTLARSLQAIFLSPLARQRGGVALRQTLSAYFAADHNVKAAAAALGVDRSTVRKRLHTAERCLGRPLHACQAELEVALGLERLDQAPDARRQLLPARRVG